MAVKRIISAAILAAASIALAACSDGDDQAAKLHEPGKHVGARDPLVEKSRSAQHTEALIKRFAMIQTDR